MIAIYCRQSVDKKDSISIETQIAFCRAQAGGQETRIYQDRGYSGSNTNRPDFQRLLSDIRQGDIHKVIIYKLDRMSRSLLDFSKLIEFFKAHQVQFQSTQEQFDTATPMGNAMLSITMVFAQLERETIQQRIRDNYYARGRKGMYLGGRPPFGYQKEETRLDGKRTYRLVPDEKQAALIREMFSRFVEEGCSLGEIGRQLNARGERTAEGKRFYPGNMTRLLRNPVYVCANADVLRYYQRQGCQCTNDAGDFIGTNGCFLYGRPDTAGEGVGRTLSLGLHAGLVDAALFLRAQEKLATHKTVSRLGTGGKSWLAGCIRCGVCGYRMSVKTSQCRDKDTGEIRAVYSYFTCNGRRYGAHTQPIPRRGLVVEEVEYLVEMELMKQIGFRRELACVRRPASSPQVDRLKAGLAAVEEQLDRLLAAVMEGNSLAVRYLNEKIEQLHRQKEELSAKIAAAKEEAGATRPICLGEVAERWEGLALSAKRRLARLFIREVRIFHEEEGDTIEIHWNYRFPMFCDTPSIQECTTTTDNPCDLFQKIRFPVEQFFPPKAEDLANEDDGYHGYCK